MHRSFITQHAQGIAELLDSAILLYRKNFKLLFGIVAVAGLPILALSLAGTLLFPQVLPAGPIDDTFSDPIVRRLTEASLALSNPISGILNLLNALIGLFTNAAVFTAVDHRLRDASCSIKDAYVNSLQHLVWLVIAGVISAFFAGLMLFPALPLFFIPGAGPLLATAVALIGIAIVGTFLSVMSPAIVAEKIGPLKSLARSVRLVRHSFWRALAVWLLFFALLYLVQFIPTTLAVTGMALIPNTSVGGGLSLLIVTLLGYIIQPLFPVVNMLLHADLRIRRDGYDLAQALERIKPPVDDEARTPVNLTQDGARA
jgi:hypothetical protein